MNDFVGTSPLLRKVLWVAMATIRFHKDQTGLFKGIFFHIQGVPGNNLAPIQIVPVVYGRSNKIL